MRHTGGARPRTSALLCAAGGLLLSACGGQPTAARNDGPQQVEVSVSSCGQGWSTDRAGTVRLRLHETDSRPGEMRLVRAGGDGAVLADVDPLGPGTSRDLALVLDPGTYTVQCLMEDEAPVTGRPVRVTGSKQRDATPGVVPVDQAELVPATKKYEAWVQSRLPTLVTQVGRLRDAVRRGDREGAQQAWRSAHTTWGTLGAAYGAFGDAGEDVDGLPDGLRGGAADPDFHGFHRLERGLWGRGSAQGLSSEADRLLRDVRRLSTDFSRAQLDPLDVTIRAHEIAEDVLQQTLSGHDDLGSHTALATTRANLTGVSAVLAVLRSLLLERHADVGAMTADVRRTDALAARLSRDGDRPVSALPVRDRERLSAAVAGLTERLAPVATVLEPRRIS